VGAVLTRLAARNWSSFADPSSSLYIEEPFYPSIASALLCLVASWPFVSTLDTVADSILFCEGVEALAGGDEAGEDSDTEGAGCCGLLRRTRGRYAVVPQSDPAEE